MPPSDFAKADLEQVLDNLTTDEAILLTAGVGLWNTHQVPRLGIPSIKVTDGPNGIRGNHFFMGTPGKCLPCATALGSTWDTDLIEEVGIKLLAPEAKLRAASLILAPTCNIQRSPLGGRSFESFSEDPFLSGMMSAAYVKGIQKGGVGSAIKHFVANDKEDDRMGYSSVLSERALREIYLMPFMLAQKYAKPWSYMTAYNRVNGTHVSENRHLLQGILRDEWKFDGMVMSDWFGVYSIDLSINAGLDLEMPGTNKWRTLDLVNRSIVSRKITVKTVKERAAKVLGLVQKCAQASPEILDGDGKERTVERDEEKLLMRHVAAESIVLLKNKGNILPLHPQELRKVAIIGGNAKAAVLSGGGSAVSKASYFISPYDGIEKVLLSSNVEVAYEEGARGYKVMPSLDFEIFTENGERGWIASWHCHTSNESMTPVEQPLETHLVDETRIFISTSAPKNITRKWTLRLRGQLRPRPYNTSFEFGLISAGRAKLYVDGGLVIDNWSRQRRGDFFFGAGSEEEKGVFALEANRIHQVLVEFCNVRAPADGDEDETVMDCNSGVRLGGAEVQDAGELIERAVAISKEADVVIAVVGLDADWETEGHDRTTLALPGRTDELILKVADVNPKIVVVSQSGSAVTMPWADSVAGIVQSWYLGNATGDAISDVLFGKVNPSGKLPLTFPKRIEDVPSFRHFDSENGIVHYAEGLFVGYKHYHQVQTAPLFAFGHGLSYTTFSYSNLQISVPVFSDNDLSITVSLDVKNTGGATGSEVVQLYVTLPTTSTLNHPPLQLKAFARVRNLPPGTRERVGMQLDKYAVSYWEERAYRWVAEKGKYLIRVGPSSENFPLQSSFVLVQGIVWCGL